MRISLDRRASWFCKVDGMSTARRPGSWIRRLMRRAVDAWTALWEMSVALSERNRTSVRTRLRQRRRGARGV
jgi:hypothetical protein